MSDPFSPAGRFEQRCRDAEQQDAQKRARIKAAAEGLEPPDWAKLPAPVPDGNAIGKALGKILAAGLTIFTNRRTQQ